ncbi:MAG: RNA-binding domain-containing protein [Candidatus Thorarchaeota archaeon]
MKFSIRCPIFPTENSELILKSLHTYFPSLSFTLIDEERERWAETKFSEANSLEAVRSFIHESRIIDATRKVIASSWTGTMFIFRLDKQAAIRGKVNLVDESDNPPLGYIEISAFCESDEIYESFLRWFTPPTKDGKIVRN